ncbi:hypothetical protein P3339_12795 [Microbulbifer sp. MLAF003]|uniref:hypothetical protein n=1 Tax=Microbulbifer sp. MLAF003 TaxID=3032582 RepID=UPI0024AD2F5E|nr:hypothetical protein [Microbulbifer sp. MLAF003]WHI49358.1 hypothetical protein P3339_12795 [Microbulbifer sp. MLAF003]
MTAETQRINLRGYLERIGYNRMPAVDLPTLKGLLSHHVRTIPFENVTSFLGGQ